FGDSPLGHPAFAVLVAGAIILLVYTVPVLGLLTLKLLGWLGLGVVLFTLIHAVKKERTTLAPAGARQPVGTMAAPMSGVEFAASGSQAVPPLVTESSAPPPPAGTPPIVSAATLPRAGFWIRLLALAIDL